MTEAEFPDAMQIALFTIPADAAQDLAQPCPLPDGVPFAFEQLFSDSSALSALVPQADPRDHFGDVDDCRPEMKEGGPMGLPLGALTWSVAKVAGQAGLGSVALRDSMSLQEANDAEHAGRHQVEVPVSMPLEEGGACDVNLGGGTSATRPAQLLPGELAATFGVAVPLQDNYPTVDSQMAQAGALALPPSPETSAPYQQKRWLGAREFSSAGILWPLAITQPVLAHAGGEPEVTLPAASQVTVAGTADVQNPEFSTKTASFDTRPPIPEGGPVVLSRSTLELPQHVTRTALIDGADTGSDATRIPERDKSEQVASRSGRSEVALPDSRVDPSAASRMSAVPGEPAGYRPASGETAHGEANEQVFGARAPIEMPRRPEHSAVPVERVAASKLARVSASAPTPREPSDSISIPAADLVSPHPAETDREVEDDVMPLSAGSVGTVNPTHSAPVRPSLTAHTADLPTSVTGQIAEAARAMADGPVEITLDPEELGRVHLTMQVGDGGMSVAIAVERPETLDLLRRHISLLEVRLQDIGYRDISFAFSQGGVGQHGEGGERSGGAVPVSPTLELPATEVEPKAYHLALGRDGMDIRL